MYSPSFFSLSPPPHLPYLPPSPLPPHPDCFPCPATYRLLEEDEDGQIKFLSPFHYESRVQSSTASSHSAARARRLAQEVVTLSTSLPLSPSSSVFVCCDEERLDIMKVCRLGVSRSHFSHHVVIPYMYNIYTCIPYHTCIIYYVWMEIETGREFSGLVACKRMLSRYHCQCYCDVMGTNIMAIL